MIVRLDSSNEFGGKIQQEWSIVLDDGTILDYDVISEPHSVEYDGPEQPLTVGDRTIDSKELLDLVFVSGDVTEDGDEVEITPAWLQTNGG